MKKAILAFDLGTSGIKCSVFDLDGIEICSSYKKYNTFYPVSGFHEQKPEDWLSSMKEAYCELDTGSFDVCCIGVSGHSLGVIPVNRNGELLVKQVPIWSDRRAVNQANSFFEETNYKTWYEKTGCGFPPYLYPLFKIMWYRDEMPEIYKNAEYFVGSKDYINLYLTGNIKTDVSYASGSGMYSLTDKVYEDEYALCAGVSLNKLPEILPSHEIIGGLCKRGSELLGLREGIPVVAGGVDNACMTLGAGCFEAGDLYASLGSSAWITVCDNRPTVDYNTKIYTFAHCVDNMFIPSAGIFSSGSAVTWAADNFFADASENKFEIIEAMAEKSDAGADGVMYNPCLAGGSAFDKSPDIKGCLFGLSLSSSRNNVARAVLEGPVMHLRLAADVFLKSGIMHDRIVLVGGGVSGELMRHLYADVFGLSTLVPVNYRSAASLGAAALAAKGCGIWDSYGKLKEVLISGKEYNPDFTNYEVYKKILPVYRKLCDACSDLGMDINLLK